MNKCIKVFKLLIEVKTMSSDERLGVMAAIKEHAMECERCAQLWDGLNNPGRPIVQERVSVGRANGSTQPTLGRNTMVLEKRVEERPGGKFFTLFIDDKEYRVEKEALTGQEIMELAGIPIDVGLIMILEDGTQVQVAADDVVELKPGRRFKRAPRFIRG